MRRGARKRVMEPNAATHAGITDQASKPIDAELATLSNPEEAAATIRHTVETTLRACAAELRIHKEAWVSEAEKFAALSAKADRDKSAHVANAAQLYHLKKLVRAAETAFYEHFTEQCTFDADGWRKLYQKMIKAVLPLFSHRD